MQKDTIKSFFKKTLAVSMATVMSLSAMYVVPAVVKDGAGSSFAIEAEAASKVKVSACTITVAKAYYTGKALKPAVTVKKGNTTYKNGKDYTVSYKNNTKLGTGSVTIKAKSGGKLTGSKTVSFKIIPAKAKLSATTTSSTVKLSWGAVKGATKYEIYSYNSSKKKYTKVATTTSKSYTVKKLSAAKTYSYAVKAIAVVSKKTYTGDYSSVLTVSTAPATVTGVKVSYKAGETSATVSWKKVSGASGYEIYNYDVKTKKYTSLGKTTKTSFTYKKIAAATEYQFCVKAYRTVSKKNYYGSYSSKVLLCTAPGKVTSLKATAGNASVTLKWAAQKNASGYTVYQYNTKTKKYEAKKNLTSTSYTVTGLKNDTSYKFAVAAYKTASNKNKYTGTQATVSCTPVNNTKKVFDDYYNAIRSGNFKISYTVPDMFNVDEDMKEFMNGEPTMTTAIKDGKVLFVTSMDTSLGDVDMSIYYDASKKSGYAYIDAMLVIKGYQKINEKQAKENGVYPDDIREMFAPKMQQNSEIKESVETYKGKKYSTITYSTSGETDVTIMFEGSSPKVIQISGGKESIVMTVSSFTKTVKDSDVKLPTGFPLGYSKMDIL